MLSIIKIGGIFLPLFSGFGVSAIVSRLKDADAKALFTADGTFRRGKFWAMQPIAEEAAAQVSTLKDLIVLTKNSEWIVAAAIAGGRTEEPLPLRTAAATTNAEKTSAEDVMMLIYTSGTTGRPKGAVHTHCGFPIKAAQDMWHGLDLHGDETLFWLTDMGWMMGPWLVFGTLVLGATMMLYDGAPDFPGPDRVWKLCNDHTVSALRVSHTQIRALRKYADEIINAHHLTKLRKLT